MILTPQYSRLDIPKSHIRCHYGPYVLQRRTATRDERCCCLGVLRLANELAAAAIAYDLDKMTPFEKLKKDQIYNTDEILHGSGRTNLEGATHFDGTDI
jgi:hypothetical protein